LGIYYYYCDYQHFVLKEGLEVERLIQVVAVEMEVKAVVGVNGSSELGGNIRSISAAIGEDLELCYCW